MGVRQNTKVTGLRRLDGGRGFSLETSGPSGEVGELQARHVVLATGYYDNPNRLSIPAEDGPKLSHYYTEAHPYWQRDVLVVGGGNSAVEAALDLYRHGARVTLVHREAALSPKLKPWVEPDIRNRLRDQAIKSFFQSELRTIGPDSVTLSTPGGPVDLPNSFVFALTGYHPDPSLLRGLGAAFDPESGAPVHDPQTMETTVPGLFIAGTLAAGNDQNQIFIENGRLHGNLIATALLERRLER